MLVRISYFYQIRFFEPWQLPLSTAMYDPKWYHDFKGNDHVFRDKRWVVNGLRIRPLMPPPISGELCHGREGCLHTPDTCEFMRTYASHLHSLDFNTFMKDLKFNCYKVCTMYNIPQRPEAILIVHEKYDNPCSERTALQSWFAENGITLSEYVPTGGVQ